MPDPEIDRRCSACGASMRPHALFCPQCGQAIATQPKVPDSLSVEDVKETKALPTPVTVAAEHDFSETQPIIAVADLSKTQPLSAVEPETASSTKRPLHRASNAARGIEENVKGRVGKLRKVSSVVIDQAAYDPSLRFILVAGFLFFLFLVLLILSKVLG